MTFRALTGDCARPADHGLPIPRAAGAVPGGGGRVRAADPARRADRPLDRVRRRGDWMISDEFDEPRTRLRLMMSDNEPDLPESNSVMDELE